MPKKLQLYRITFVNQGTIYEIYAKRVNPSSLLGFIELEDLVFESKSQVVVDPSETRLKAEFDGVKRSYIPIGSVIRIDEVEKRGQAKITELNHKDSGANIAVFPPLFTPPRS